jgi:transcriptional regulator with XRE-family HTH domain
MLLPVNEAIRELRAALGLSQQALATKLDMALSSIAHYESGRRTPEGTAAVKLYRAAMEAERQDLADVFLTIFHDAMGHLIAPVRNDEEHRAIRALQLVLFDPRFRRYQEDLIRVLGPALDHLRKEEKRKARESTELFERLDAWAERQKGQKK